MCDLLSRSFAHFYSKLNNGRKLSFGALRKAYITQMEIYSGGKSEELVGHSNNNTKRHYLIPEIVAKASINFKVFPERSKELQNQRTRSDEKENQKIIDL